jgi:hypothetical protein
VILFDRENVGVISAEAVVSLPDGIMNGDILNVGSKIMDR